MTTEPRLLFLRLMFVLCLFRSSKADWLQDLQSGETVSVGEGVKVRVDNITDGANQTSYFSSHVLRVFVGDSGLSLAKAKGKEGLQIDLFTANADGSAEARGSDANVFSVVLPLLIGFKIAGSILTTLVAVLLVSLKAFLASVVALLLTGAGALKKMMGHAIPAEVHYPMEYYPHHPPTAYDYPSAQGYSAAPHSAPPHSAPSSPGHSYHEHEHPEPGDHEHHSGPTATAADSNVVAQYVAANASAAPAPAVRRRVYKRRNPSYGLPMMTVAKITRKEAL